MGFFRRRNGAASRPRPQRLVEIRALPHDDVVFTWAGFFQLWGVEGKDPFDAFVITRAPAIDCDELAFFCLPTGELLVDQEVTASVSPSADAVEEKLRGRR